MQHSAITGGSAPSDHTLEEEEIEMETAAAILTKLLYDQRPELGEKVTEAASHTEGLNLIVQDYLAVMNRLIQFTPEAKKKLRAGMRGN